MASAIGSIRSVLASSVHTVVKQALIPSLSLLRTLWGIQGVSRTLSDVVAVTNGVGEAMANHTIMHLVQASLGNLLLAMTVPA